jgi:hypothetical protein
MKKDMVTIAPYNGELKAAFNNKNPETMFIARKAADEIIAYAFRQLLE